MRSNLDTYDPATDTFKAYGGIPKAYPTVTECNPRTDLLHTAEQYVNGDRNVQYGDPIEDFRRTAALMSAYLGVEVAPHDVAVLIALVKVSRIRWSPDKKDHWADLAGYAACGWDVVTHTHGAS